MEVAKMRVKQESHFSFYCAMLLHIQPGVGNSALKHITLSLFSAGNLARRISMPTTPAGTAPLRLYYLTVTYQYSTTLLYYIDLC